MSTKTPLINAGDPVVPEEIRNQYTAPDDEKKLPTINNWRRYDRGLWGEIVDLDGSTTGNVDQVPGLIVKLVPREGWVIMDTGQYYRLGQRAYAGT